MARGCCWAAQKQSALGVAGKAARGRANVCVDSKSSSKYFKSAGMAFDKDGPGTRNRAKVPLQCAASRFRRRTRTMPLSIALSQRPVRHALQHWPHAHVVGQDEKQLTERIRVRLRSACLVIP